LLEQEPSVDGIAVPSMPVGSSGMEHGGRSEGYTVMAFGDDGTEIFARHGR